MADMGMTEPHPASRSKCAADCLGSEMRITSKAFAD